MTWVRILKTPQKLQGYVQIPASKSISNRALIIQHLSSQKFPIHNLSFADDTLLLKQILEDEEHDLYIKNAGTAMRFLTAYFARAEGKDVVLRGSSRMHERPVSPLVNALKILGAEIDYLENEGFPPLHISGRKLSGGEVVLPADKSSQFASALLLIAPTLSSPLTIDLQGDVVSEPYIWLTLKMLSYFGIQYKFENNTIYIGPQKYLPRPFQVENDWSSASYWFALAAVADEAEITLPALFQNSYQGDSILQRLMPFFGIETDFHNNGCTLRKTGAASTSLFEYDFIDHPDLIPTFVSLCCAMKIPFKITGTRTLKFKESVRDEVLQAELQKLGFQIHREENIMSCHNFNESQPELLASIFTGDDIWMKTYDDHRMAMSWAILAAKNPNIWIENPACTEKSYPNFWAELQAQGFVLEEK